MSFVNERVIGAIRKARACDGCGKRLAVGEGAIGWAGLTDGIFVTATYHIDCRHAEIDLNNLHDFRFGDDWIPLTDIDSEERGWLIEKYPEVAARMNIVEQSK